MKIPVSFPWYWIPISVVLTGLVWSLMIAKCENYGLCRGMTGPLIFVPSFMISALAWFVACFLKY